MDKNQLFGMYENWCSVNNKRDGRPLGKSKFFKLIRDYGESFQARMCGKQTHVFAIKCVGSDGTVDIHKNQGGGENGKPSTSKGVKRKRAAPRV